MIQVSITDINKESWAAIDTIGVSKTVRVMKLLNLRSFELKSGVHEVFDHVWKSLAHVDIEAASIAIYETIPGRVIRIL